MVAVVCMCVIVYPARTEVDKMCCNNKDNSRNQEYGFVASEMLSH